MAADGIDEWLTELSPRRPTAARTPGAGLADGESLHVHAADVPDGSGEWLVSHDPAGITVRRVHEQGTVALRGGASDLLLVCCSGSRLTPGRPLHGDPAVLVAGWTQPVLRWPAAAAAGRRPAPPLRPFEEVLHDPPVPGLDRRPEAAAARFSSCTTVA